METGFDCVDRGVRKRTHGSGNQTDECGLVAGEWRVRILGLPFLEELFEFGVGGEVYCLVGPYTYPLLTNYPQNPVFGARVFMVAGNEVRGLALSESG